MLRLGKELAENQLMLKNLTCLTDLAACDLVFYSLEEGGSSNSTLKEAFRIAADLHIQLIVITETLPKLLETQMNWDDADVQQFSVAGPVATLESLLLMDNVELTPDISNLKIVLAPREAQPDAVSWIRGHLWGSGSTVAVSNCILDRNVELYLAFGTNSIETASVSCHDQAEGILMDNSAETLVKAIAFASGKHVSHAKCKVM
jgi:hypothetical protein